ncbi:MULTISPECIES: 50S ribosomal protein L32e [unclassified Methanosarcina]|uniref:50S ribosomal protein L32e n=1 Tax=unclassified Methanosarcina TaxID=2644672 RepID=UPI000616160D|nr:MULTISPECIES: 50S ribosomal protein L32e [unclassified Methanosarcina]AKB17578.1 LSU ribosomal protein L32e [Methanosarcina sp. WWM596]AKB20970.1 LSU ribosomal protein L32e [Methanosarcina sp. WH1]
MGEEFNEVEGTSVSALDMDPESRRLFNVRKVQKGKKPQFKRTCSHKFKRLDTNWRRPRGSQGKQRRKYVAKGALAQVGYGSPAAVKGLHPSGYSDVLITSIAELELVDPSFEAIRIARTIGAQKKAIILAKAEELGIKVLNPGRSE